MTQAPSIKEALERSIVAIDDWLNVYASELCNQDRVDEANHRISNAGGTLAYLANVQQQNRAALATLQPSGERRDAIARRLKSRIGSGRTVTVGPGLYEDISEAADALASGLVQDEAGWRDISTAPKDGTPFIGAFWSIRWADSHRKGDVVTCWWQPEFEAFISACREMSLAPGLTFENGETRQLHSPVIEPVTHWKPLDRPVIRSARNGGAET